MGVRGLSKIRLENNQESIIKEYSNGATIKSLCKKYGLHFYFIAPLLKEVGIYRKKDSKRTVTFNTRYFQFVDTHEKAYLLGLIYADGNVHKNKLQISSIDKEIPLSFKKALGSNIKITSWMPKISKNRSYKFTASNIDLIKDLNRLGVFERKSLLIKFPRPDILKTKYYGSFMLGYFDGDGCVTTYKPPEGKGNTKWNFSIISTKHFCMYYNRILSKRFKIFESSITKYKRIPEKDIWEIHKCGVYTDELQKIYDFLYHNYPNGLARKIKKFKEILATNLRSKYSSIYHGVTKSGNKWKARKITGFKETRKVIFEKDFLTEIEAAKFFDAKMVALNLDKRYLNFPEDYE